MAISIGIDLSVTDNTAISGDIGGTDPTAVSADITVTDPTVITEDLSVTDATAVSGDITVTDPTTITEDLSVTDPTSVIINTLDGLVLFDFENNPSLINQNKNTIQRELTPAGTVTYNQLGYYELSASTDSKIYATADIASPLPPTPVQAHQWYEMKFVVGITGTSSSTILNPQGEGFRWRYYLSFGGASGVEYYKDTSLETDDNNNGTLSGKITATFSCYFDGADTILKTTVNGVTGINTTLTGDKRIVTEPLSDIIFGFASTIDKIYYISWEHSDIKTNADFS